MMLEHLIGIKDLHTHVLELQTVSRRFVESLCIKSSRTTRKKKSEEKFQNRRDIPRALL